MPKIVSTSAAASPLLVAPSVIGRQAIRALRLGWLRRSGAGCFPRRERAEVSMELGIVGLGRMGANMARRLMRDGHQIVAYDVNPEAISTLAGE
ncbi:MAG TPA: NAD(P)-binding domain-containing protein, partial [Solirubrobacterales bacterium]|nr:NAD(P)-binding domain-containing protein [Solirubrobacterales bacterium]